MNENENEERFRIELLANPASRSYLIELSRIPYEREG